MGIGQWMRVLDTVSGLVQMSGRFRRSPEGEFPPAPGPGGGPLGQLEARLAGVVVAALKEAFDRDRARMDLERSHMDAERQRAEEALRAELRRQAVERSLGQLRLVALMAFGLLMVSAALSVWMPGMRAVLPRALVGTGWLLSIAALGCAFAAWQHVSAWSAPTGPAGSGAAPDPSSSQPRTLAAAPWLLVGSLALTLSALLSAL
jgi:hypothetical protein